MDMKPALQVMFTFGYGFGSEYFMAFDQKQILTMFEGLASAQIFLKLCPGLPISGQASWISYAVARKITRPSPHKLPPLYHDQAYKMMKGLYFYQNEYKKLEKSGIAP